MCGNEGHLHLYIPAHVTDWQFHSELLSSRDIYTDLRRLFHSDLTFSLTFILTWVDSRLGVSRLQDQVPPFVYLNAPVYVDYSLSLLTATSYHKNGTVLNTSGIGGPYLRHYLERIHWTRSNQDPTQLIRCLQKSLPDQHLLPLPKSKIGRSRRGVSVRGLINTLQDFPELGVYTLKASIDRHAYSRYMPLIHNVIFDMMLRSCSNMEELHFRSLVPVNVQAAACKTSHSRLKRLSIYATYGMERTRFGSLMEACPNLEPFKYSEQDSDPYTSGGSISPADVVLALKPCEKALRSLKLVYNQYAHGYHDETIKDLRHFTNLESLVVSADEISHLDQKLPVSLKLLELFYVDETRVGELRRLAQGACQRLPVLQQIALDAAYHPGPLKIYDQTLTLPSYSWRFPEL